MDERTLDRVARCAGFLRNRTQAGVATTLFCSEGRFQLGQVDDLHEFAGDVLEMVGLLRKARAAMADVQREYNEILTGTFGVSTADVDLFAPPRSAEEPFPAEPSYLRPDGGPAKRYVEVFRDPGFGGRGEIDKTE